MLKILQARLQQYMNRELPDVQAGFSKGRGTRDQIANIRWIMAEKAIATHVSTLVWKSHGRRSLVGRSPWGLKESDMTE